MFLVVLFAVYFANTMAHKTIKMQEEKDQYLALMQQATNTPAA
jgi:hypothetical protein